MPSKRTRLWVRDRRFLPIFVFPLWFLPCPMAGPVQVAAQGTPAAAGEVFRLLLDTRTRFEAVESGAFERDARALTLRVRAGVEARFPEGIGLLVEVDATRALGIGNFNSTVNGQTEYPAVVDPRSERLNRLQAAVGSAPSRQVVAGRQRIIHDDARFVGNVGFRQNEQTLDAVRLRTPLPGGAALDYAYAWGVNRIFGSESPAGQEGARLHLAHLARPVPGGMLAAFGYWSTFRDALEPQSSRTVGARFAGSRPVGRGLRLRYGISAAHQEALSDARVDFFLGHVRLEGGVSHAATGLSGSGNWEHLGGDGARGFSFPLATLHAWQGYTDVFLSTPPDGLNDLRLELAWDRPATGRDMPARITLRRHAFSTPGASGGSTALPGIPPTTSPGGGEWNVEFRAVPRPGVALMARVADFRTDAPGASSPWGSDVRKFWVSVEYTRP